MAHHPVQHLLLKILIAALALAAATAAAAADVDPQVAAPPTAAAVKQIYQQRLPDGRVVLTDRPQREATTERTWLAPPEDVSAARARREEARLAALAVDERIRRQLDAQRQHDLALEMERLRLSAALAAADAQRARLEADAQPIVIAAPAYRSWRMTTPHRHAPPRADRPGAKPRPPARPGWWGSQG